MGWFCTDTSKFIIRETQVQNLQPTSKTSCSDDGGKGQPGTLGAGNHGGVALDEAAPPSRTSLSLKFRMTLLGHKFKILFILPSV